MFEDNNKTERSWFVNPEEGDIPIQLSDIISSLLLPAGFKITKPQREVESREYGACQFDIDGKRAMFRVAHTTPRKLGQFVTMWKRPSTKNEIMPIDFDDGIEFVLVCVFDLFNRGLFVFNKQVLLRNGVMSFKGKGGKRAIRVYPSWVKPMVKQAVMTQKWQLPNFVSANVSDININKMSSLLRIDRIF